MVRWVFLLAAAAFALTVGAVGCGDDDGGDDFEDIKQTATAAALRTPSPGPTTDPAVAYYAEAAKLAKELGDLVNTLDADMLAAAQSQGDPKWPSVLAADADLVIAKAQQLDRLPAPGSVPQTLTGKINQAVDGLAAGAELLKQAILKLDPAVGAEASATIDNAENLLDEVRAELDAKAAK